MVEVQSQAGPGAPGPAVSPGNLALAASQRPAAPHLVLVRAHEKGTQFSLHGTTGQTLGGMYTSQVQCPSGLHWEEVCHYAFGTVNQQTVV